MNKLLTLLSCLVALTTAGILDPIRILDIKDRQLIGTDRILGMSRDELLRQKFLLDVLLHVEQPLVNEEFLRLGQELIIDPQQYLNRLDEEMLNFIELYRTQRLLGQEDTYSFTNESNLRQMIGLYRILVNSRDWDVFQRNVCFARTHINAVLFVNSLILAVRDREDTRMLIMPAIHEILPALFLDENLVRKVQQLDISQLDSETRRPGLLDLISFGRRRQLLQRSGLSMDTLLDRSQLWMPWRELHTEVAMRRATGVPANTFVRSEEKIVIPVERSVGAGVNRDMSLLTEDIGLNGFLYNLINDLVLEDYEILADKRSQRVDDDYVVPRNDRMDQTIGRVELERNDGLALEKDILSLAGRRTDIDDRRVDDSFADDRLSDDRRDDDRLSDIRRINDPRIYDTRINEPYFDSRRVQDRRVGDVEDVRTDIDDRLVDDRRFADSRVDEEEGVSDTDRVLRTGRRRMLNRVEADMDNDRISMVENRIAGGRRVVERDSRIQRGDDRSNKNTLRREELAEGLPITTEDDDRLLRVSRRRMNGINQREQFINIVRGDRMNDGRPILGREPELKFDEDRRTRMNRERYTQNLNERPMQDRLVDKDDLTNRYVVRERVPLERDIQFDRTRDDQLYDQDESSSQKLNEERSARVNRDRIDTDTSDVDDEELTVPRRKIGEGHRVQNRDDSYRQKFNQRYLRNDPRGFDEDQERRYIDERNLRENEEGRKIVDRRMLFDERLPLDDQIRRRQLQNLDETKFRTTTIDDERLLHINRRHHHHQNIENPVEGKQLEHFEHLVQRGIRDARRTLERTDERDLDTAVRNNINEERISKINNRRRMGVLPEGRRRLDETLEQQQYVQRNLLRGMEDIGTERLDSNRELREKEGQRLMDFGADEPIVSTRQGMDDERLTNDYTQLRREYFNSPDNLKQSRRGRLIEVNDERGRLARSLPSDVINTDRTIFQRLRGGELFLHNLQQLMARIDMERISLRLTDLDLDKMDIQGQRMNNPRLTDDTNTAARWALRLNDMRLDTRRNRFLLQRINEIEQSFITVIERELQNIKIRDQTDIDRIIGNILLGRVEGTAGILRIIQDLLQENTDTQEVNTLPPRRNIINFIRDPIVQHLLRRIVRIVDVQRQKLGAYQLEEIQLDGVQINDINVDHLRTNVELDDVDLINLVDQRAMPKRDQLQQQVLVARQQRLNHKSFKIDIALTADREQSVVMRTFLLPKVDANDRVMSLDESRLNALLLDATVVNLHVGQNFVKRKSRDISWTTRDTTPFSAIYERVMRGIDGRLENIIPTETIVGNNCRFPHRLLLPRGRVDGLPMQLLVVVTPVSDIDRELQRNTFDDKLMCGIGVGTMKLDRLPLSFPLDRRITAVEQFLDLPNLLIKDVMIFHED